MFTRYVSAEPAPAIGFTTTGDGTGIVFDHYTTDGVRWALDTALGLYRDPDAWRAVVANGMAEDFSWEQQAERYVAIYQQLLIH